MIPRQPPSGPHINLPAAPGVFDNGNSGAEKTIDWSRGPSQKITATANCTLDLLEGLPPGESCHLMLQVTQDGTGSRIVVLPFVKTSNNSDLIFTTTPNRYDLVSLYWDGHVLVGAFFAKNFTL